MADVGYEVPLTIFPVSALLKQSRRCALQCHCSRLASALGVHLALFDKVFQGVCKAVARAGLLPRGLHVVCVAI